MSDQNGGDGSVEAPVAMAAASESAAGFTGFFSFVSVQRHFGGQNSVS